MRALSAAAALIALLHAGGGCRESTGTADAAQRDSVVLAARVTRLTEALAKATSGAEREKPVARWILPPDLAEISGLALTADGRLFAHSDESAKITELDYRRGTVIKQFFVGKQGFKGDFEGLAFAEDRFFMLASEGTLYEFQEGAAGERVEFRVHDTHLGKECEFEGVAYDSAASGLVLACKNVGVTKLRGRIVLYRFALGDSGTGKLSEITVPFAAAIGKNEWKQVRPTDITMDPFNGNFVLVAAQEQAILEITPVGEVVFSRPLGKRHPQSEGVAITRDSILIISDEAVKGPATLTLYRWP
jgi:uncharacterized protein YjiK